MSKGRNTTMVGFRIDDKAYNEIKARAGSNGISVGDWCKAASIYYLRRSDNAIKVNNSPIRSDNTRDIQPDPEKLAKFRDKYGV